MLKKKKPSSSGVGTRVSSSPASVKTLAKFYDESNLVSVIGESSVIRRMFTPINLIGGRDEGIVAFMEDGVHCDIQDIIKGIGMSLFISKDSFIDYEFKATNNEDGNESREVLIGLYTMSVISNIPDVDDSICSARINVETMTFDIEIDSFAEENALIEPINVLTYNPDMGKFIEKIMTSVSTTITMLADEFNSAVNMLKKGDISFEFDSEGEKLILHTDDKISKKSKYIITNKYITEYSGPNAETTYGSDYIKIVVLLIKSFSDFIDTITIYFQSNMPMIVDFGLLGDSYMRVIVAPIIERVDPTRREMTDEEHDERSKAETTDMIAKAKLRKPVVKKQLGGKREVTE